MLDDEIAAVIRRKTETAHVDYKAGFEWKKENKDQQLELLRDMMAMANTRDGGVILLGIEDGTRQEGINDRVRTY
jgi:predicted HTH transcriptional regulator